MYVICTDNLVTNEFGTFACDEKVSIIDTKSCGHIFLHSTDWKNNME